MWRRILLISVASATMKEKLPLGVQAMQTDEGKRSLVILLFLKITFLFLFQQ